jgi:addiction module RelE/StbE family toxin
MKIIWTPRAADDLEYVVHEISADQPDAAVRVASRIYDHVLMLADLPHMGRKGALPGTRELVFNPWPYIAVYRVSEDAVRILRIRHGAQQWPAEE